MVHNDGPQCADTTAGAAREVTAGQRFLIGDASLGWNPAAEPMRPLMDWTLQQRRYATPSKIRRLAMVVAILRRRQSSTGLISLRKSDYTRTRFFCRRSRRHYPALR